MQRKRRFCLGKAVYVFACPFIDVFLTHKPKRSGLHVIFS